ncbi:flagellar biosynthesis repressor FlbT [Salinarimonas soli]|uniref:Flagellar biosynthesis repressor FlbT n=1 Tax=Salinarimonas soli TaxID=1638099 RepID=A0A5B2V5B5_9HYPH|nr:flagellar biosynthesis repressor FlbT [Salinarimonas soli]KAA2234713.1 flagellar biosynthesis repressor FlbT [Salinarimonas soli]
MRLSLRAGEKVYINGAVLQVDRKVTVELLNDVVFLMENHVMQPEETTTPLRQLYFTIQAMFVDPINAPAARVLFDTYHASTARHFSSPEILDGLAEVRAQIEAGRNFDALKILRTLFPAEDRILARPAASTRAA